ncbi:magnesium-translocating P-type ATPase [bacterium]|nr:magnesium-translocating P-type ATPase [bacterium]
MNDSFEWNQPLKSVLSDLGTGVGGLSSAEATSRLERIGPNSATDSRRPPLWLQFVLRFRNPLILLLLAASGLSALTGDHASFLIVVAILAISVTLDFVQEVRAEKAVDALRQSVALRTEVIRDGKEMEILVREVVPGDVILLSSGMLVPADGRLIDARDLFVNQALLTGESYPAEKAAGDLPRPTEAIDEAVNCVFMGTSIISGSCRMVVVATGARTRLGSLSGQLAGSHEPTSFEIGMERFGMLLLRIAVVMVLFVLLVNLALERPILDSFLFALALAIGLAPELLPMIVTISLARGAIRMAQRRAILKHLPAMHNLGAMDVLCTDKTGTLTEANIRLEKTLDCDWHESRDVFTLAYANATFESGVKSPLDLALLEHESLDLSGWTKIDEVPFDFERRRISVLVASPTRRLLIVKGAPEDILNCSTHYGTSEVSHSLDADRRAEVIEKFEALGEEGFRVLGIAFRDASPDRSDARVSDETELTFTGFAVFLDPPRADAAQTLKALASDGIQVKVLSGDNERVTRHVCDLLGFDVGSIMTGEELQHISDESLVARIDATNAFCRVTPQQKSRIIAALHRRGRTVGFLGDGINDAPALHQADVGISVESATDVAREAADLILLEKDMSVIHGGVIEGRRSVINTNKYILMGSASTFGNAFSMAMASLMLPFLPLLPIQVLLNDLIYDLSQTVLPFDNVDEDLLANPVRWDLERVKRTMWILGPSSSMFDLVTMFVLLHFLHAGEATFRTVWFLGSLVTQLLIVFALRTQKPMFRSRPHPSLIYVVCGFAVFAFLLPWTSMGRWFGFVSLPIGYYLFPLLACTGYTLFVEFLKRRFKYYL